MARGKRQDPGWVEDRGFDPATAVRLVIGLVAVLIAVLAVLALLNSFFVQPRGPNPGNSPAPTGNPGAGGSRWTCQRIIDTFRWTFFGLAFTTLVLFSVAVARREKHGGNVATSIWGILSLIGFFFSLAGLGAWRLMAFLCSREQSCAKLINGAEGLFLFLALLTTVPIALALYQSHRTRKHFFATGWGVIGTVLYLPMILAAFFWYFVRTMCNIGNLSCATKHDILGTLLQTGAVSFILGATALGMGLFVAKRFRHGVFRSGWGFVAIMALLLSLFAWLGYYYVDGIRIPGCDEVPPMEEPPERTCEQVRDAIQGRLAALFWTCVAGVVAGLGTALYLRRARPKEALKHWAAIAAYVLIGVAVVAGLLWMLAGGLCGQGEGDDAGRGGRDQGPGGSDGGGGGDGGSGTGGGGVGEVAPLVLNPQMLAWILGIVAVVIAAAILFQLFRSRKAFLEAAETPAPQPDVLAEERAELLRLLDTGNLTSAEAVIAAYRAFLAWCDARGLDKQPTETSVEHSLRVLHRYPMPREAMAAFVRAYEVARLSGRAPTPEERARAVEFSKRLASSEEPAP